MAEQRSDDTPRRYEETMEPQNPPNSVLSKGARRAAVWSYFVPVVVLFVVVGIALVYWSNQPENSRTSADGRSEIGTVGRSDSGTTGREEGGIQPDRRPGDTREEIEYRGDDLAPITSVADLDDVNARQMNGRRVSIDEAEVDSVSGNRLMIREGDRTFAVITPDGAPTVKSGSKVSIEGRLSADSNGQPQIRADRVQVKG